MSSWRFDVVTLSGMPGSGTTTAARLVTAATGFRHVNTGAIFREMARERGLPLNEFGKLANDNPEIDRELDRRQIERTRAGRILLEGRLAGYMIKREGIPSLSVWLAAPLEVRMRRVAGRDQQQLTKAVALSKEREEDERMRFLEFYGFDLAQTTVYDLILDSSRHRSEAICQAIMEHLRVPGTG